MTRRPFAFVVTCIKTETTPPIFDFGLLVFVVGAIDFGAAALTVTLEIVPLVVPEPPPPHAANASVEVVSRGRGGLCDDTNKVRSFAPAAGDPLPKRTVS